MGGRLILETSFLIDLERDAARRTEGRAHAFLAARPEARLYVTPTIAGELAAGLSLSRREAWERFLAPFHLLAIDAEVAWRYGETQRYLAANGLLIGTNDLWIAAVALAAGMPVVTRNAREFSRVPGLEVLSHR